jgi:hypothetical protein
MPHCRRSHLLLQSTLITFFLLVLPLGAQEGPQNAVHANPWGIMRELAPDVNLPISSYGAGYERKILNNHALMGELVYIGLEEAFSLGAGVHYRYHLSPRLDSFYFGPFLRYSYNQGETEPESGPGPAADQEFTAHGVVLGGSVGQRWIVGPGIILGARLGMGYTVLLINSSRNDPALDQRVLDLLRFPLGIDGELSVGWAF